MSKKSRRRNKKILGALLLGGLGLAAANRNKGPVSTKTTIMDNMPKDDIEFKETVVATPVSTKTTIMDSMPARPKLNQKSKRVTDKGEVYTIKGVKDGIPPKIGNKKSMFVGDNYIYQDGKPYTKGRYGTFAARNKKPAMLDPNMTYTTPTPVSEFKTSNFDYFSKGGRVKKRTGAAKRGFGRAFKGGKK